MAFVTVYFSLGSNLGNRAENIASALRLLDGAMGCRYSALSRLIETEPMGFAGNTFLNGAVRYRTPRPEASAEVAGLALLDKVEAIEQALGRKDVPEYDTAGRRVYHSRIIDIDILFYGNEHIQHERLVVPHPGIADRPFVMVPLRRIALPSLKRAFPEIFAGRSPLADPSGSVR
jgi:2-amino-4-hydroxy-6-hydroxymethyldihydropteridine diphosphokinase